MELDAAMESRYGSKGLSSESYSDRNHRTAEIREIWMDRVKRWLDRDYFESGCCGGVFPLERWKKGDPDQKEVPLWDQMNTWLWEHLDENGQFILEKNG